MGTRRTTARTNSDYRIVFRGRQYHRMDFEGDRSSRICGSTSVEGFWRVCVIDDDSVVLLTHLEYHHIKKGSIRTVFQITWNNQRTHRKSRDILPDNSQSSHKGSTDGPTVSRHLHRHKSQEVTCSSSIINRFFNLFF